MRTPLGRHEPPALTSSQLDDLVAGVLSGSAARAGRGDGTGHGAEAEQAVRLFIEIARAQPFQDGDKRTAIFAANALQLGTDTTAGGRSRASCDGSFTAGAWCGELPDVLLVVPFAEDDPEPGRRLSDLLARAYIHHADEPLVEFLLEHGITTAR